MTNLRPALAALTLALTGALALAQSQTAPAPEAAPAAAPESGPAADFKVLFGQIGAKLQAGQQTEEALAEELKGFDAIIAKYPGRKDDEVAMVVFMKARLYLEVFENTPRAVAILKQLKADYPETEIGRKVDEMVGQIEGQATAEAALAVGKAFPDFAEQDLAGQPLALAAYKGKLVLVDFWATWCGPCVAELPNVIAAYEKYHDKGFEIVGISLDEDRAALDAFLKEHKMPWPQYFDGQGWKNKLGRQYGINSIPATFLLDREGKIIAKNLRGPALDKKLAELLAK